MVFHYKSFSLIFFLNVSHWRDSRRLYTHSFYQPFDLNPADQPVIRMQLRKIFTEPKFTLILNFRAFKNTHWVYNLEPTVREGQAVSSDSAPSDFASKHLRQGRQHLYKIFWTDEVKPPTTSCLAWCLGLVAVFFFLPPSDE